MAVFGGEISSSKSWGRWRHPPLVAFGPSTLLLLLLFFFVHLEGVPEHLDHVVLIGCEVDLEPLVQPRGRQDVLGDEVEADLVSCSVQLDLRLLLLRHQSPRASLVPKIFVHAGGAHEVGQDGDEELFVPLSHFCLVDFGGSVCVCWLARLVFLFVKFCLCTAGPFVAWNRSVGRWGRGRGGIPVWMHSNKAGGAPPFFGFK